MIKERPIAFSGPMARAILEGRKTQTRRVAKLTDAGHVKEPRGHRRWHTGDENSSLACPYGQPGDRLWVREAHYRIPQAVPPETQCFYDADGDLPTMDTLHSWGLYKKYPPMYTPRWAARILLEIKSVRVERLQDIDGDDALSEGVTCEGEKYRSPVDAFADLWESINGKTPGKTWNDNPWVWVIEFEVCHD